MDREQSEKVIKVLLDELDAVKLKSKAPEGKLTFYYFGIKASILFALRHAIPHSSNVRWKFPGEKSSATAPAGAGGHRLR